MEIKKGQVNKKFTEWDYHDQEGTDVAHKYVKIFCNTNQFPSFTFFGPHTKPHGVRGFIKHYYM